MRKKLDHRDRTLVLWWDTEYEGAAIYALVDDDGKMYIGRTYTLQKRLHTHRRALNCARAGERGYTYEGHRLIDAAAAGKNFHAIVLKSIPPEKASENEVRYWECYYYQLYGKRRKPNEIAYNLYNSTLPTAPNYAYKPNDIPRKTVT